MGRNNKTYTPARALWDMFTKMPKIIIAIIMLPWVVDEVEVKKCDDLFEDEEE